MVGTEQRNPKTKNIDKASTQEIISLIHDENYNAVKAIDSAIPQIVKACDIISSNIEKGGRLFYVGAGTSGRLGVVDASEIPPTYGVRNVVIGIIAGGNECMFNAKEGVEDDRDAGEKDIAKYDVNANDVVVGISANGNAGYIVSALEYAKAKGCAIMCITCNPNGKLAEMSDVSMVTETGAEVVTGSTRMKAGTAQKLVLNMLSTCAMIKTGKVYENLMINLKPTNLKLKNRMIYIVTEIVDCTAVDAEKALEMSNWDIRTAVDLIKGE